MENTEKSTQITESRKKAIKKKAWELFDLIEDTCEQSHCDDTCEMLQEEIGDLLLDHHGFSELYWAYKMAQPTSEQAMWSLEEVLRGLNDDDLYKLLSLSKAGIFVSDIFLDDDKDVKDNTWAIQHSLRKIREYGKMLLDEVTTQYWCRAEDYREEIEELKEAS